MIFVGLLRIVLQKNIILKKLSLWIIKKIVLDLMRSIKLTFRSWPVDRLTSFGEKEGGGACDAIWDCSGVEEAPACAAGTADGA